MAYDPTMAGARPGPSSPTGAFDRLKAGMSNPNAWATGLGGFGAGLGEGMMDQKFRSAYNAGQGGLSTLYGINRMGAGLGTNLADKNVAGNDVEAAQKEAQQFLQRIRGGR